MAYKDPYVQTIWKNEETVINETNLNKIEARIKELENAESLIAGKLDRARLQNAVMSTTNSDSTRGAVAVVSATNSLLEGGFAATPKAVNDARLECATTGNTIFANTRKSTLAVQAEKLLNPIELILAGGVTGSTSFTGSAVGASHSISVVVDPTKHIHTRPYVNANATLTETGFVKPIKSIDGLNLGRDITEVPHLDVAIQLNRDLLAKEANLSARIGVNTSGISNITKLNDTYLEGTALKTMKDNVQTLVNWQPVFQSETNTQINKLNSDIAAQKTLNSTLATKMEVTKLSSDIEAKKADKTALNSLASETMVSLGLKADKTALNSLDNKTTTALGLKADKTSLTMVDSKVNDLSEVVDINEATVQTELQNILEELELKATEADLNQIWRSVQAIAEFVQYEGPLPPPEARE